MKELINLLSYPSYSFTFACIAFALMLKYYHFVGTKKFGLFLFLSFVIGMTAAGTDHNFFLIITWPDNVPITILLLTVGFFTWLCFHKASINDRRIEEGLPPVEGTPENREKVWTWPNLVYTELFAGIAFTVFLILWGVIFKAPLEEPANPTWAPNPAKAPWYFLGLQEMLVYFDPWMAGVVLPGIIIVGMIAIPYIDQNPKGNGYYTFAERKTAISTFLFGWLALWIYLIIIGTFLRGPNWTFYGPFEYWDFHKVVAESNVNLSEYFWIKGLGMNLPSNILVREIIGILTCLVYFVAGGLAIFKSKKGRALFQGIGAIRFYIFVFLVLSMGSLPIKMYLRWLFNLKYIIAMPEFEFNL